MMGMADSSRSTSSSTLSELGEASSQPFPFFNLPAELRRQILDQVMRVDRIIDIDFNAAGLTSLLLVSRQFHDEATAAFYGGNTFRLLPTHAKAASRRAQPLLKMFAPHHRASITSLELRLGPFWTQPPLCWKVDDALGLEDAESVRTLQVWVECDPAHPMYQGFRKSKSFYTNFAGKLMEQIARRLPNLKIVCLNGYPSVLPTGPLIQRLVREIEEAGKKIVWGPGFIFENISEKLEVVRISLLSQSAGLI